MKYTLIATGGITHIASEYSDGAKSATTSGAKAIKNKLANAVKLSVLYATGAISAISFFLIFP